MLNSIIKSATIGLMLSAAPVYAQSSVAVQTQGAEVAAPLTQRAQDIVLVLSGDKAPDTVFSKEFLAQIPATQIAEMGMQLTSQYGDLLGVNEVTHVDASTAKVMLHFEKAIITNMITIDAAEPFPIIGWFMTSVDPIGDTAEKISADIDALPGEVSAYFGPVDGSAPVFAINADEQMALGSTFKLYVLSALARSIANGERGWADVVTLTARNVPSGQMQDWPAGAPVTLQTLATMMISVSDNTATDQLIAIVGRETVEAELRRSGHSDPERTLPLFTTAELFAYKGDPALRTAFEAADEAEQARQLEEFAAALAEGSAKIILPTTNKPNAIDTIEWFASADDLRKLIASIGQSDDPVVREVIAVNPGIPQNPDGFDYIGYKGGSEPGVLNLTWLLTDKQGVDYVMTLGWNNPKAGVDHSILISIANRILALHGQ